MAKKMKAKRTGDLIFLPKYVNAEMLMLEYFRDEFPEVHLHPGHDKGNYHTVSISYPDDVKFLDGLIIYINLNI